MNIECLSEIIGCFFCFVFCSAAKWKTTYPVVPESVGTFHGLTYYVYPPIYAFFLCVLFLVTPCLLLAVQALKKEEKDAYCNAVQLRFCSPSWQLDVGLSWDTLPASNC